MTCWKYTLRTFDLIYSSHFSFCSFHYWTKLLERSIVWCLRKCLYVCDGVWWPDWNDPVARSKIVCMVGAAHLGHHVSDYIWNIYTKCAHEAFSLIKIINFWLHIVVPFVVHFDSQRLVLCPTCSVTSSLIAWFPQIIQRPNLTWSKIQALFNSCKFFRHQFS